MAAAAAAQGSFPCGLPGTGDKVIGEQFSLDLLRSDGLSVKTTYPSSKVGTTPDNPISWERKGTHHELL